MFLQLQGKGEQEDIDKRINQIKDDIELSSSEYEKEKLNERLAKLSNGIAVVKVNISKIIEVCGPDMYYFNVFLDSDRQSY